MFTETLGNAVFWFGNFFLGGVLLWALIDPRVARTILH